MNALTLPNTISLTRIPLAFLFLIENNYIRLLALLLAGVSDFVDGYLARRYKSTSKLGASLDPLADKFFIFFILAVFTLEKQIALWQVLTMLTRDFALILYGGYLLIQKRWERTRFRPAFWSKATTALQLGVLILVTLGVQIPPVSFLIFPIFALFVFLELLQNKKPKAL